MSVGVLLMTHESMGAALVNAARHVLGRLPLPVEVQEVAANADPDLMLRAAAANARGQAFVTFETRFGFLSSVCRQHIERR